jgi:ribonucleoside-triphosphate reductase (thioredoxin)
LTYISKYSRRKANGNKERWHETCARVVNGYYSILKDHCKQNRTPWNEFKAQKAAQDAYDRMFTFKWLPPGRGLWMMGTEFVNGQRNSAALQNCAFISTEKLSNHSAAEATMPFVRLMEMSMLGVGVGFDVLGAGNLLLHEPDPESVTTIVIEDSREGWYESVGSLLESYFFKNRATVKFDYSEIRSAGEPIKGFGGVAAGPSPLMSLHKVIRSIFDCRGGERITTLDIADLMNLIGKCVVAGNVRRSAEIALGNLEDDEFINLKNFEVYPERNGADGWAFTSNNSVFATIGTDLNKLGSLIADNGEPGAVYMDLCRKYGRLIDPENNRDYRAAGTNPCGEQTLESYECCTLVETFPTHHESVDDYIATLKHAYLYGKAVTLLSTHWPETNEVMQRNRRIGCSMTGVAQFVEERGWTELRSWMDESYNYIQRRDRKYSEWLGVRESIKTTSIKPSGTVSLLAGVTPGVHWPVASGTYIRRTRYAANDPLVKVFIDAGFEVEPDVMDPKHTVVVSFPTVGPKVRTEREVSMWEKADLAVAAQAYWADNQVSVTITFRDDEKLDIPRLLQSKEGQLKSLSMLPLFEAGGAYAQMPYEAISEERQVEMASKITKIDTAALYGKDAEDAEGEKFCNNDTCLIEF